MSIEEMPYMGITHNKIVGDQLLSLNLMLTEEFKLSEIQGDCYEGLYGATEKAKNISKCDFFITQDIQRLEVCTGPSVTQNRSTSDGNYPERH